MAATLGTVYSLDHITPINRPTPVACDAVNGNRVPNGGTLMIEFTPAAGGTVTVTFPNKVDGQTVSPLTYTLTGTTPRLVGGWPVSIYGAELTFTASVNTITYIAYQV